MILYIANQVYFHITIYRLMLPYVSFNHIRVDTKTDLKSFLLMVAVNIILQDSLGHKFIKCKHYKSLIGLTFGQEVRVSSLPLHYDNVSTWIYYFYTFISHVVESKHNSIDFPEGFSFRKQFKVPPMQLHQDNVGHWIYFLYVFINHAVKSKCCSNIRIKQVIGLDLLLLCLY